MIEKFRLWLRRWLEVPEAQQTINIDARGAQDDIFEKVMKAVRAHGARGY